MFRLILWDLFGKFSNQLVGFLVSIVLARLLLPAQFGLIGIALALVGLASIFFDFGFKSAIIQRDKVSQEQLSTVFFLNFGAGIVLFLLFSLSSFAIERFYGIEGLAKVIVAVSSLFVINSLLLVPAALLARNLQFKKTALINFAAAFVSGSISIFLAYNGWGVWALVVQATLSATIVLVCTFAISRWKPNWRWNISEIKPLWQFGSRIFGVSLMENIFSRLDVFLIGKFFGGTTLGYYTRAQSLDATVRQFSAGSLIAVVLPYFSRIKDDVEQIKKFYLESLHLVAFISILLVGNLYVVAPELFIFLFTEKWVYSGYLYQILAIAGFVYPVSALMVNVLWARGNQKLIVGVEIYKKLFVLPFFCFGFIWGLEIFMYLLAGAYICTLAFNAWFVSKDLRVSFLGQLVVIGQYLVVGTLCVVAFILLENYFPAQLATRLFTVLVSYTAAYLLLNFVIRTQGSRFFLDKLKGLLLKGRKK